MAVAKDQMDMETNKIFGIGFHKTGTTSLHQALKMLGYRAIHGDPRFGPPYGDEGRTLLTYIRRGDYRLPTIERYDAFTDNPYFSIWRELDQTFPNSKFILTIRDEEAWLRSCLNYYRNRRIRPMRAWMFGEYADPASSQAAQQAWLAAYRRHNQDIITHFENRPHDLLILNLVQGEGWEKLCSFLDRPIPGQPFPFTNSFQAKQQMNRKKNILLSRLKTKIKGGIYKTLDRVINRKTFFFISHPKSGRTWLAIALGKIMEDRFHIPHHAVIKPYQYLQLNQPAIPRIIFSHIWSRKLLSQQNYFTPKGKRIFFLARDPRDVVVSYYHQMTMRKQKFEGTISEFMRNEQRGIYKVIRYMNYFAERQAQFHSFYLIRYEEMHADLSKVLGQICQQMGIEVSSELVHAAVEWSQFDNMQERERGGFYTQKIRELNPRDIENVNTFKVRKGKIGSYREELSAEDIAFLDQAITDHLHPLFDFYKNT